MKSMKAVLLLCVLGVAGTYLPGAIVLSESRTQRFLDELESLSLRGENREFCARMHEDLEVSIRDRSASPPAEIDGGKQEFCEYVSYATRGLDLLGVSMQVRRENFKVTRSWRHPWTAEVAYFESRITRMEKVNVTLRTESDDYWKLVNTLDGVKVLRLRTQTRLAP